MFVLLDEGEMLVYVFLRAMLLPQERLSQEVEPY
ncbi:hypothetical protein PMI26_05690 [Pseudomonas sp. GM33]|nr:hypothetical protein PMI26_05690 [Pseudomonas sp. GM33]